MPPEAPVMRTWMSLRPKSRVDMVGVEVELVVRGLLAVGISVVGMWELCSDDGKF